MTTTLTILGCGNSSGVPAAGNVWGACDPAEPRNLRTRSAAMVRSATTTLVIDTGPDFRAQTIREDIGQVDAVLYSHHHSDHVNGIDDLRGYALRSRQPVPVYGSTETLEILKSYFPYAFFGGNHEIYPPILTSHVFGQQDFGKKQTIGDISFIPFQIDHGSCTVTGYRFGDTAYCVDMLTLDDAAVDTLRGIKNWIVDCAGYQSPAPKVHANLETVYRLNETIGATNVYLSSLSLSMDYQTLKKQLPKGYSPAWDGLRIDVCF